MTSSTHTHLSPLTDFIHDAYEQVVLSTDDAAAEAALKKFWSPHAEET
jgi:hypothetical protein